MKADGDWGSGNVELREGWKKERVQTEERGGERESGQIEEEEEAHRKLSKAWSVVGRTGGEAPGR